MFIQLFLLTLTCQSAELGKCDFTTSNIENDNGKTSYSNLDCSTKSFTFSTDENKNIYTTIPDDFFSGSKIGSVTISAKITSIGSNAFKDATIINELNLQGAGELKTISNSAFQSATIPGIVFPAKLEYIYTSAFEDCTVNGNLDFQSSDSFSSIYYLSGSFTSTITKVFAGATITGSFIWPKNLNNLYLSKDSDNKYKYEEFQFYGCTVGTLDLSKFTGKTIGTHTFCNIKVTTAIKFPTELETIGDCAFQYAQITPAISFPNTLKTISFNAFEESSIPSVTFNAINSKYLLETIGDSAFKNIISLTAVNNLVVKTIEANAFEGCRNLVINKIEIVGSGTIGGSAFLNCYELNSELEIKEAADIKEEDGTLKYSTIGGKAFQNSGIKTIKLPYIESIGGNAFENCTRLTGGGSISAEKISDSAFKDDTNLVLSSINATTISQSAFENCRKLGANIEVYYYGGIEPKAFKNCKTLGNLKFDYYEEDIVATKDKNDFTEDLKQIGSEAFYRSGLKGKVEIPITINEIGDNAFAHCEQLTSLTIHECDDKDLVLKIREKAFYRSGLNGKLIIPNQVGLIEDYAFAYCNINNLEVNGAYFSFSETINSPTGPTQITYSNTHIFEYSFYSCNINTLTFKKGDVIFQKTTFRGCPLETLSLGNIKTIPTEAFYGMSSITNEVKIPDTVTTIEDRAFAGCSQITSITFNDAPQLNTVKDGAFYGCSELRSITLPLEVTTIPKYAFYKCSKLESITIGNLVTDIQNYAFYGCSGATNSLTFPIELTQIGEHAFEGCRQITGSLEFPDAFTSVGKNAFMGCTSLNGHVSFGRSITTIDDYAFRDCYGFKETLTFPEYLYDSKALSINKGAFYGCSGFTGGLTLPKDTTLQDDAFNGCSGFNGELNLNEMTSIPNGAFRGCSGFTGSIPTHLLTSIGEHAFDGCSGFTGPLDLTSLTTSPLTIEKYAFCNCKGLNGPLILPGEFEEVNEYAFYGCSGLTGGLDCSKFTHIHRYAFYGCSGLTGPLEFEDTLTNVDQYAFAECSGFSDKLTFRIDTSSKLDIDQCAFKGCKGFKKGKLSFMLQSNEESFTSGGVANNENFAPYYRYDYFLKIGNDAFDGTKFKDVYYLGRFEPDCDYDIGISQIKGIHTSSNYANKTFCNYPLHKSKLSGGAIAGIVIAVIVVVAVIVFLIVFFILRAKKNKDNSEGEVEMNNEP